MVTHAPQSLTSNSLEGFGDFGQRPWRCPTSHSRPTYPHQLTRMPSQKSLISLRQNLITHEIDLSTKNGLHASIIRLSFQFIDRESLSLRSNSQKVAQKSFQHMRRQQYHISFTLSFPLLSVKIRVLIGGRNTLLSATLQPISYVSYFLTFSIESQNIPSLLVQVCPFLDVCLLLPRSEDNPGNNEHREFQVVITDSTANNDQQTLQIARFFGCGGNIVVRSNMGKPSLH